MAHKLILKAPLKGMTFLWNIDDTVGSSIREKNNKDDVALVQILLALAVPNLANQLETCKIAPTVTGSLDIVTGFQIYYFQHDTQADGFLSPINPKFINQFTLYRINQVAHRHNPIAWENLGTQASVPQYLKMSLATRK